MNIDTASYIDHGYKLLGVTGTPEINWYAARRFARRAAELRKEFMHYAELSVDTGSDWIVALNETAGNVLAAHLAIEDLLGKTIGAVDAEWIAPNASRELVHEVAAGLWSDLSETEMIFAFYD